MISSVRIPVQPEGCLFKSKQVQLCGPVYVPDGHSEGPRPDLVSTSEGSLQTPQGVPVKDVHAQKLRVL